MKQLFSKILSLFLIVVLSLGTLGFTISKHNCGGKVVKKAIGFSKSDVDCGMAKKAAKCPRHKGITKGCCSNSYQLFQVTNIFEEFNSVKPFQEIQWVVVPVALKIKAVISYENSVEFVYQDVRKVRQRLFVFICSFLV